LSILLTVGPEHCKSFALILKMIGCPLGQTGTIAAREHEKWLKAVPLPNNPYSTDKLVERIQRGDSATFGATADAA
jgi:hypothetical protein